MDEGWEILEKSLERLEDPVFVSLFWRKLSKFETNSPAVTLNLIRVDLREENFESAASRVERLIEAGESFELAEKLRTKVKLAEILIAEGAPKTAIEITLTLDDNGPERYRLLVNAHREIGDTAAASLSASQGLEIAPNHHGLRFAVLRLAWDLGDMEDVVVQANMILEDKPSHSTAHRFRLNALVKIGNIERLEDAINSTLAVVPGHIDAHRVAIDVAFSEYHDWKRTLHHCEQILSEYPEDRRSLCHKAHALSMLGKSDAALQVIESATEFHPEDDDVDLTAAQIHWKKEDGMHLERINRMLARYQLAPISSAADNHNIAVENIQCNPPICEEKGPLVSIIMTVYGRDQYLDVAINSILNQTYQNIELIIVDDRSPDDAFEYLQEWEQREPRLKIIQVEENGGTYLAKNTALLEVSGEYVAFMDSDDWTHPQRLERQVEKFQDDNDIKAVWHANLRIDENGNIMYKGKGVIRRACISLMCRREVFDQIGFFDSIRVGADTEFIERIVAHWGDGALLHDPLPTMFMLQHSSSLTGGGPFHISWRSITGPRLAHHSEFRFWHKRIKYGNENPYVSNSLGSRPFPVPEEMICGISKEGDQ